MHQHTDDFQRKTATRNDVKLSILFSCFTVTIRVEKRKEKKNQQRMRMRMRDLVEFNFATKKTTHSLYFPSLSKHVSFESDRLLAWMNPFRLQSSRINRNVLFLTCMTDLLPKFEEFTEYACLSHRSYSPNVFMRVNDCQIKTFSLSSSLLIPILIDVGEN